jgi:Holliday junction resolvase
LAAVARLWAGAFVARGLVAALRGAAFAVVRRAGAGFAAARRVVA